MSLKDTIAAKFNPMDITDVKWVQYVKDHLEILKSSSVTITLTDAQLRANQYKLEYILNSNALPEYYSWIVCLLNGISSNEEFFNQSTLLLPSSTELRNMYNTYNSTSNP